MSFRCSVEEKPVVQSRHMMTMITHPFWQADIQQPHMTHYRFKAVRTNWAAAFFFLLFLTKLHTWCLGKSCTIFCNVSFAMHTLNIFYSLDIKIHFYKATTNFISLFAYQLFWFSSLNIKNAIHIKCTTRQQKGKKWLHFMYDNTTAKKVAFTLRYIVASEVWLSIRAINHTTFYTLMIVWTKKQQIAVHFI